MKRLVLLLVLSCGPHDVESVAFPDGGRPMPQGAPCSDNTGCNTSEYCEKRECSDSAGFCVPRMCKPMGGAVCGCDGVTYASRCARREAGVSEAFPGSCQ